MTPGARVAAAIEILDVIRDNQPAEQALTRWARNSRFAGSKDRAAVRDYVYDVLRRRETAARLGGGPDGRALMLGLLRVQGADPARLFTGEGHAPSPLSAEETSFQPASPIDENDWNLPDWLIPALEDSLGRAALPTAVALQERAPVTVRANLLKTTRAQAKAKLAEEGVQSTENARSDTALTLQEGARRLRGTASYAEGFVELQDASSQAVVDLLPLRGRCLDYCAGGGGKALAMAAQNRTEIYAHDGNPTRMKDLKARATRAGCEIPQLSTNALSDAGPFDLVLCDAPCSGSGAWRRSPDGKWQLTPEGLSELTRIQDSILDSAAQLVAQDGILVFATCSILKTENEIRVAQFLSAHPGWTCVLQKRYDIASEGDGFFTAHLTRG